MRPPNGKRGRSRGRNKGGHHGGGGGGGGHGGHNVNRTLDSNGPDVKIRGTAMHIHEKYLALARNSHSSGDRIGAENYLQHAEHYHRLMMSMYPQGMPMQPQSGQGHMNGSGEGDDEGSGLEGPQGGGGMPQQNYSGHGNQQQHQPQQNYQQQPQHQPQPQSRPVEPRQAEPRQAEPRQAEPPRTDGEQALAFDRRLNGRSRRVSAEDRNGRAVTALDESKAAPSTADEAGDDADEALA